MYDLHGTECSFFHKRLLRAAGGFITGGPAGAIAAGLGGGGGGGGRRMPTQAELARQAAAADPRFSTPAAMATDVLGHIRHGHIPGTSAGHAFQAKFASGIIPSGIASGGPCLPFQQRDPISGECKFFIGNKPGIDDPTARFQVGAAVMGRYGAGYYPGSKIIDRAICLAGDVVGNDGICYPKRSIKNSEREWPRGRRPLLTGGEMRAIGVASRAAGRLTRTAVRLQELGLIKKPVARKRLKKKN